MKLLMQFYSNETRLDMNKTDQGSGIFSELTLSDHLDEISHDNDLNDNEVSEKSTLLEEGDRSWGEGLFGRRQRVTHPRLTEKIENFCSSKTMLKILAYLFLLGILVGMIYMCYIFGVKRQEKQELDKLNNHNHKVFNM